MTGYSNGSGGLITDDAEFAKWCDAFGEDLRGSSEHETAMALHESGASLEVARLHCTPRHVEGYSGGLHWSGCSGGLTAQVAFTGLPTIDAWQVVISEWTGATRLARYRGRGSRLDDAVAHAETAWERGHGYAVVGDEDEEAA